MVVKRSIVFSLLISLVLAYSANAQAGTQVTNTPQTKSPDTKTSDTKTDSQGKNTQPQSLTDDQVKAIMDRCRLDPTETDPKKANKAVACVNQAVLAVRRLRKTSAALESLRTGAPPHPQKFLDPPPPQPQPPRAPGFPPGTLLHGSHVRGS